MRSSLRLGAVAAFLTFATAGALTGVASAEQPANSPSMSFATFEGGVIDLRKGWGEARACATDGVSTTCFRTEKQLQAHLGEPSTAARSAVGVAESGISRAVGCATTLRLYDGTGYTGTTLYLIDRNIVFNLSAAGFAAVTSSYQVGACSSVFKDQDFLGGSTYPGSTGAGVGATAMVPGWNNRVRSVYIY
jgi:hypothetical protein